MPQIPISAPLPRVSFYERTAIQGGYRYRKISINNRHGDTHLHTLHPPVVGDLIQLWDATERRGGMYQVVARQWLHSSYGSMDWPHGESSPNVGPLLDIVVEAAEGAFRDEAPSEEE
ncbi:hypothetical protein ACFXB3_07485 [Streptomyces sp. NPDC059447]|uniref:hypothetical protein n=1 Tax=Streptomyces sp. NPDC059447 TaxID=3346834 RepID=UPI0036CEFCFE